jgi:hypothetical protein
MHYDAGCLVGADDHNNYDVTIVDGISSRGTLCKLYRFGYGLMGISLEVWQLDVQYLFTEYLKYSKHYLLVYLI